ncbi:MAG: SPOR domain-containing protein [Gammaproteobacteria bacterium]|nr:SPOR domain-containing protein [Gammaproteobacteria bacterium]
MEQKLKERLIGTAAITVLAAVFLPMLIDEDDQRWETQDTVSKVPPLPDKYKKTPKIVSEADFDQNQLFPGSNQSVDISDNKQRSAAKTVTPGQAEKSDVPVIEKPVLSTKSATTRTPDMKKQLDSLLPSTAKSTATSGSVKPVQQKKQTVVAKSVISKSKPKPTPQVRQTSANKQQTTVVSRHNQSSVKPAVSSKPGLAKPDNTGLWIIQVGVFKDKSNAGTLMKKLKKNGFAAYLEPVTTEVGKLIRVRAGRVPKEKAARQMVTTLNKRFGLKAITFPETKWNSLRAGR